MSVINTLQNKFIEYKDTFVDYRIESIIALLNFIPSRAGFSILNTKNSVLFWMIHFFLVLYVYGLGSIMYQLNVAQGPIDLIKSYVNLTLVILIINNSYWFIVKRGILTKLIEKVISNDTQSRQLDFLKPKHMKLLRTIKIIVYIFYGFNILDVIFVYLPHRSDVTNEYYSNVACVGIKPLTHAPKKQLCQLILSATELSICTVVLNYQALIFFLIAHTAAMYQLLSEEILSYDEENLTSAALKQRLVVLISRHTTTLEIIKTMKDLYSMPIGINFGINAICIILSFALPWEEWVNLSPVYIYCFLVFFLYCHLCQTLINASEEFEDAVYGCGWEKFDLKEQRTIYVMLLQAQKPVILLAADIVPVNIYTFATTMQAMFKFITVFKF